MAKLFCVSDIHGFYNELITALNEAGFDKDNPEHWIIVCGDCFDRGPQPVEVMKYLMGLERKILVKGNHEQLLVECCERGYPGTHDYSNGTFDSICEFGGAGLGRSFDECCVVTESRVKPFLNSMVNYFETKNYIFVHSFIPSLYDEDWRTAHQFEWDEAMWGNPFELASKGLLPDKTLVFGHFHTSWARRIFDGEPEWGDEANFSPYFGDGFIGIDGCTAYSRKVNVLVIEDEFM